MKDLGVNRILAHSPRAKGHVERRHGVFQDRFVKALHLEKISTIKSANEYLNETFLDEMNARFTATAQVFATE